AERARGGGDGEVGGGRAAAPRELERADPGAPVEAARRLQVLVRVPERAIVDGVDGHRAVVPPAAEAPRLRPDTGRQGVLGLHRPRRVADEATGVADAWPYAAARDAIAEEHVALLVLGDRPHPARGRVGGERPRLEEGGGAPGVANLVPTNARGRGSDRHRV